MKKEDIIELHPNGMVKYHKSYHANGELKKEEFRNIIGQLHRLHDPCTIYYYDNTFIHKIFYARNNKWYNVNNPAQIIYTNNGQIGIKRYGIDNHLSYHDRLIWVNLIKNI